MESDSNQDLPDDILEKLRNLELELEDGDITLKGFEKKKASLLADISNPSSPVSPTNQKSEAELLAELGPEPSAADVVDFLDFLPSPTHSPTRTVEAVNHMEENHRQMQQQQQGQPQPYPTFPPQQQPQYQPSPQLQQQQQYVSAQQQQMRPMQPQYRPFPPGGIGRGGNNAGPYYGNSPLPNNRPYMVRNNYAQQPPPPQSQMGRPMGPPGSNPYYGQRPPSSILPQNVMYRPQQQPYNSNQPRPQITTSPRPMYRPQPRPNGGYRPQQPQYMQSNGQPPPLQQQQQQQQSQQHGNYYSSGTPGGGGSGVSINRSLSANTGANSVSNNNMGKQYDQQQRQYLSMHSTRNDSMEWNRQ
ncbi:hypothetical protein V8B55DRAFT_1522048 [Mucor lusitanicus]|nr:hypothetical protein FB192DRAFT_1155728 [Mucor lusitanicus]